MNGNILVIKNLIRSRNISVFVHIPPFRISFLSIRLTKWAVQIEFCVVYHCLKCCVTNQIQVVFFFSYFVK